MIICIYIYGPLASVELIITSYQTMKMNKYINLNEILNPCLSCKML